MAIPASVQESAAGTFAGNWLFLTLALSQREREFRVIISHPSNRYPAMRFDIGSCVGEKARAYWQNLVCVRHLGLSTPAIHIQSLRDWIVPPASSSIPPAKAYGMLVHSPEP